MENNRPTSGPTFRLNEDQLRAEAARGGNFHSTAEKMIQMKWKRLVVVGKQAYATITPDDTSLMVVKAADKDWFASFRREGEETVFLPFSYETAEDAMNGVLMRVVG